MAGTGLDCLAKLTIIRQHGSAWPSLPSVPSPSSGSPRFRSAFRANGTAPHPRFNAGMVGPPTERNFRSCGRRNLCWAGRYRCSPHRPDEHAPNRGVAFGLCAAGFGWLWVVQDSPARTEHTTAKWFWVLYYPGTEGYYDEARHRMNDVPSYLADYQRRMADGDYLHFGTHPPGLILFHRALINLCEASPGLRDFLVQTRIDGLPRRRRCDGAS